MAIMHPDAGPDPDSTSRAEEDIYRLLQTQLGSDYRVVHSARWHVKGKGPSTRDGATSFIVIHPDRGILAIEVVDGLVEQDRHTGMWYRTAREASRSKGRGRAKRVRLKVSPLEQAATARQALMDKLTVTAKFQAELQRLPIGYAVWFPETLWPLKGQDMADGSGALVLDQADMQSAEAAVERLFQHHGHPGAGESSPYPRLTRAQLENVVSLVYQSPVLVAPQVTRAVPTLAEVIDTESAGVRRLTEMQYKQFCAMWRGARQMSVVGAAGTGKTVLAVETAWRLAEEGFDILLLVRNDTMAAWLRQCIADDLRPEKPPIQVHSLSSLCRALSEQASLLGEAASDNGSMKRRQAQMAHILDATVRRLEAKRQSMPYDGIVVDDCEDFDIGVGMQVQKLLRDRRNGFFYVFYDAKQRIDLPDDRIFRPAGQRPTVPLDENWRNSQHIFKLMTEYFPERKGDPCRGPVGRPVRFIDPKHVDCTVADDPDGEYSALAAAIGELTAEGSKVKPEDILIITFRQWSGNALHPSRWLRTEERDRVGVRLRWIGDGPKPGHLAISTVDSAKGLEYKVVILTELDGVQHSDRRESLLYVAVSRAMHHLVVLGSYEDIKPRTNLWSTVFG